MSDCQFVVSKDRPVDKQVVSTCFVTLVKDGPFKGIWDANKEFIGLYLLTFISQVSL